MKSAPPPPFSQSKLQTSRSDSVIDRTFRNTSFIHGCDTLCTCGDIRVLKGWTRPEGKRGDKCEMGVNDHWVKWPKSPRRGWARVPSFLSVLMMHPCQFMGFNDICHIVQLSQSLTKTWIFILKLEYGSILRAELGVIPSLLQFPFIEHKKNVCMWGMYVGESRLLFFAR